MHVQLQINSKHETQHKYISIAHPVELSIQTKSKARTFVANVMSWGNLYELHVEGFLKFEADSCCSCTLYALLLTGFGLLIPFLNEHFVYDVYMNDLHIFWVMQK